MLAWGTGVTMSKYRIQLGKRGEELARQHLEKAGYTILTQNWRTRFGEIDLVAEKAGVVVFAEVKARTSHDFGTPEEAVTRRKRQKLIRTAQAYLGTAGLDQAQWRIDVIALDIDKEGNVDRIEHYEDIILDG